MGARGRCVPFLRLLWTRSHGAIVRLLEWDGPDVLPTTSHEASGSCVNDSEAPRADDAGNASSRMDRSAASCTAGSAEPARKIVPARTEQTVARHRQGRQGPMVGSLSLYGVHACFRWCGPFVSRSPERSRAPTARHRTVVHRMVVHRFVTSSFFPLRRLPQRCCSALKTPPPP